MMLGPALFWLWLAALYAVTQCRLNRNWGWLAFWVAVLALASGAGLALLGVGR
jgi:hypothetical protein